MKPNGENLPVMRKTKKKLTADQIQYRITCAKEDLDEARKNVDRASAIRYLCEERLLGVLAEQLPGVTAGDLEVGAWECPPQLNGKPDPNYDPWWSVSPSPIDTCVYNKTKDTYLDDCLYCGWPEERRGSKWT